MVQLLETAPLKASIRDAQTAVQKELKTTIDTFKQRHPHYNELAIHSTVRVTKRAAPGSGKVIPALLQRLLWTDGVTMTQTELIQAIQPQFLQYKIPNSIWKREIQPYQWVIINRWIPNASNPDVRTLSTRGCKTLADIRNKIKIIHANQTKNEEFKVAISFTKDTLKIGNQTYSITESQSKGKTYRKARIACDGERHSINIDALIALLRAS